MRYLTQLSVTSSQPCANRRCNSSNYCWPNVAPTSTAYIVPTLPQPSANVIPTIRQRYPNHHPTLPQPSTNVAPTIRQRYSKHHPTLSQPSANVAPTISQHCPNHQPMLPQPSANVTPTIRQHYPKHIPVCSKPSKNEHIYNKKYSFYFKYVSQCKVTISFYLSIVERTKILCNIIMYT